VLTFYLASCAFTSLPSDVRTSIGQTQSGITSNNARLNNTKNITQDNYITHTSVGYFGNQAIIQSDTDFLPPIFNNNIQLDKQFFGVRSIASGITDLTGIPTILDITVTDNDGCSDIRITQQDGSLSELLNLIASRCDFSWSYREGKIILADTQTKTWIIKNIPGVLLGVLLVMLVEVVAVVPQDNPNLKDNKIPHKILHLIYKIASGIIYKME
jgi:hypothetical protein